MHTTANTTADTTTTAKKTDASILSQVAVVLLNMTNVLLPLPPKITNWLFDNLIALSHNLAKKLLCAAGRLKNFPLVLLLPAAKLVYKCPLYFQIGSGLVTDQPTRVRNPRLHYTDFLSAGSRSVQAAHGRM